MCFSAPVSFIASGGLAVAGGASLFIAEKKDKVLAAVPFLFAIQQGLEGMQWLHLNAGSPSLFAGYGFLLFAFIIWPIYVPSFVYILDVKKRKTLRWFIGIGILTALYFLFILLTQTPYIHEFRSCVNYDLHIPFYIPAIAAYLVAVFGPFFVSSRKYFKLFGFIVAALALVAWLFFAYAFVSVWCFFAAIVSALFFLYIKDRKEG